VSGQAKPVIKLRAVVQFSRAALRLYSEMAKMDSSSKLPCEEGVGADRPASLDVSAIRLVSKVLVTKHCWRGNFLLSPAVSCIHGVE
jgi:hypothetical protein